MVRGYEYRSKSQIHNYNSYFCSLAMEVLWQHIWHPQFLQIPDVSTERRILCESFWLCNTTAECFRKAGTADTLKELLKCTSLRLSSEECSGLNTAQAVTPASVACC